MPFVNGERLERAHLPKFKRPVATGRKNLALISFIEADIERGIWSLELLKNLKPLNTSFQYCYGAGSNNAKVLRLRHHQFSLLEWTEPHWNIWKMRVSVMDWLHGFLHFESDILMD